jgi:hypothetical protein
MPKSGNKMSKGDRKKGTNEIKAKKKSARNEDKKEIISVGFKRI